MQSSSRTVRLRAPRDIEILPGRTLPSGFYTGVKDTFRYTMELPPGGTDIAPRWIDVTEFVPIVLIGMTGLVLEVGTRDWKNDDTIVADVPVVAAETGFLSSLWRAARTSLASWIN